MRDLRRDSSEEAVMLAEGRGSVGVALYVQDGKLV